MVPAATGAARAPVLWLLTDNKPGHRNQLRGLGARLKALAGASVYWLDATEYRIPLWRALLGLAPRLEPNLPAPDLIIAAGSGTHRLLLSLRRIGNARTVVLMKPGFPLNWVDAAIVPEHDGITDNTAGNTRLLLTEGVINTLTPLARLTTKQEALALIGGPSPHYEWDDDVVFDQLLHLMRSYPDWHWTLSGSRRTPDTLRQRLRDLAGARVTVAEPEQTHEDWLAHRLAASRAVWVTPDSASMVYEAVTSGIPTGLFELSANTGSRVARGNALLHQRGRVARWSDHTSVMSAASVPSRSLWEADRAARWLLQRLPGRTAP